MDQAEGTKVSEMKGNALLAHSFYLSVTIRYYFI